jgi:hypothetical protein
MKRPRKRLRMFSLLLASINIHYNVSFAVRGFNLTYVGCGSFAPDRHGDRGRGMSASPPEATKLLQLLM